jgi:hypothetical protein
MAAAGGLILHRIGFGLGLLRDEAGEGNDVPVTYIGVEQPEGLPPLPLWFRP